MDPPNLGGNLGGFAPDWSQLVAILRPQTPQKPLTATGLTSRRKLSQLGKNLHGMQGVSSSSPLGSIEKTQA